MIMVTALMMTPMPRNAQDMSDDGAADDDDDDDDDDNGNVYR